MFSPSFTRDPVRIQILQRNYEEGVSREKVNYQKRAEDDLKLMNPSPLHISKLRHAVGLN